VSLEVILGVSTAEVVETGGSAGVVQFGRGK